MMSFMTTQNSVKVDENIYLFLIKDNVAYEEVVSLDFSIVRKLIYTM